MSIEAAMAAQVVVLFMWFVKILCNEEIDRFFSRLEWKHKAKRRRQRFDRRYGKKAKRLTYID